MGPRVVKVAHREFVNIAYSQLGCRRDRDDDPVPKSRWLYIDYHERNVPKSVVLCMDKNDYKKIFDAVRAHTGNEVESVGGTKGKANKETNAKETKDRENS